jgi:putative hydrolase of the HAD superfamily
VQAVIFDLDNCLCDAMEAGAALFAPAFKALRRANRGALTPAVLQRALADCWHTAFDAVAERYGFSPLMVQAGHRAFARLEVRTPLRGYPDLPVVRELAVRRYLVTSGFRRLQASKIRALGIESWFDAVVIDAIDDERHPGKRQIFEQILTRGAWSPCQVLVVGDNPNSELAAGRQLGMPTVQTLRPRVRRSAAADHHITTLDELKPLIVPQ